MKNQNINQKTGRILRGNLDLTLEVQLLKQLNNTL
jgi:hypothetical protein